MKVFKPPHIAKKLDLQSITVFAGGSIEMGKAINWQPEIEQLCENFDVTLFNPRRDNWDSSWEQTIKNPYFNEQVNWEMDYLETVDIAIFFLQAGTLSPISIGEIYYLAGISPMKMIVAVEPGFWRRGNIEVLAKREGFTLVSSLEELKSELLKELNVRTERSKIQADREPWPENY